MGTIYLLHFSQKLCHAGHYLGYTENLEERLETHRKGKGARLLQVITEQGISFELVRTWEGDRKLERKLKKQKKATKLCPICSAQKRTRTD